MSRKFATGTTTTVLSSRNEVETMVRRFGAHQIIAYEDPEQAIVQFSARDRMVRLTIPLPTEESMSTTGTGRQRSAGATQEARNQEIRRRWRALVLLVKAKITAVEDGIVTFEQEFLANVVMADGKTAYEHSRAAIALSYAGGTVQKLLPDFRRPE